MKNKTIKTLIIVSVVIFGIGLFSAIGIQADLLYKIISDNTEMNVDGSDLAPLFKIIGSVGTIAISMVIVLISLGVICSIWIVYLIIKSIKSGRLSKKRSFAIAGILILLLAGGIAIRAHHSIDWEYNIAYREGANEYNIYKTKNNEIIVEAITQPACSSSSCKEVIKKAEIKFSEENMTVVNNFFDSFFAYHDYNVILIAGSQLDENQINILNSIIYNDESLLNIKD